MPIHISELLPREINIEEFKTGSELLLAYELEKYTKLMLPEDEKKLSLKGIKVSEALTATEIFRFVTQKGLELDTEIINSSKEKIPMSKYYSANLFRPLPVALTDNENSLIFNVASDDERNSAFSNPNRSFVYISLVAYIWVKSRAEKRPIPKLIIDHNDYKHIDREYSELQSLLERKILTDEIFQLNSSFNTDPWEAFVNEKRKVGLMEEKSMSSDKYAHLKNKYEVGDVFLRYTRKKRDVEDKVGVLTSCYPAIIRGYDQHKIRLEYICTTETRRTEYERVKKFLEGIKDKSLVGEFSAHDFVMQGAYRKTEIIDYDEIGIGDCLYDERIFVIPLVKGDNTSQVLERISGEKIQLLEEQFDTLDTIYAVFKDRGILFGEKRFLDTYFQDRTPKWNSYKKEQS